MAFKTATLEALKARIALLAPAGAGKSLGALLLARGLAGPSGRIAVIDTERGRSRSYAKLIPGGFDVDCLEAPFTPERYLASLEEAFRLGYDVVVVDSLTHEWAGTGGILDMVSTEQARDKNQYTAWKKPSDAHSRFIDRIVQSPCHVICTMRTKMAYEQYEEGGKKKVRKLGLQPIQRDGVEYEWDLVFDIDENHESTVSKANTAYSQAIKDFLASHRKITVEVGAAIRGWIEEAPAPDKADPRAKLLESIEIGTGVCRKLGAPEFDVHMCQPEDGDDIPALEEKLAKLRTLKDAAKAAKKATETAVAPSGAGASTTPPPPAGSVADTSEATLKQKVYDLAASILDLSDTGAIAPFKSSEGFEDWMIVTYATNVENAKADQLVLVLANLSTIHKGLLAREGAQA